MIRHEHELFNSSSAESGTVYPIDWKNGDTYERAVAGTLTSGDSIAIEVSLDNSAFITVLTFTATTYGGTFTGPWKFLRATKTGANGAAVVDVIA